MELKPEHSVLGGEPQGRRGRMSPEDVAAALAEDAAEVARALLGSENKQHSNRRTLRWGRKGSLEVVIQGPKRGKWFDHEAQEGGDLLSLTWREHGRDGGWEWARQRVDDLDGAPTRPVLSAAGRVEKRKREAKESAEDAARRRRAAQRIWDTGQPIAGTQTEAYLRARGCWPLPPGAVVRFAPDARDRDGKRFPAMLAKLTKPDGTFCAVQMTFLDREGSPRKAANANPGKMTCGPMEAGAVWLTPPGEHRHVVIGEGVESTLSAWLAVPGAGAVAVLSTRYAAVNLPPSVREVTIAVDVDPPDEKHGGRRPGESAAREAAAKWTAEGRRVWLAWPGAPDGKKVDFNDLLQREGLDAVRAVYEAREWVHAPGDGEWAVREAVRDAMAAFRPSLPRGVVLDVLPVKLPEAVPLAEAEAIIEREVGEAVEATARAQAWKAIKPVATRAAWAALEALPVDDPRRQPGRKRRCFLASVRADCKRAIRDELVAAGVPQDAPMPRRLLLETTTGTGKTEAAIRAVVKLKDGPLRHVLAVWLVPSHDLAKEARKRFINARMPEDQVVVLGGRERTGDDGKPLCEQTKLPDDPLGELTRLGLSVRENLCEREGAACAFREQCGYYRQARKIPAGAVIIAAHNSLRFSLPGGLNLADLHPVVFVDESPLGVLRGKTENAAVAWLSTMAWRRDGVWPEVAGVLRGVVDLLNVADPSEPGWREDPAMRDLSREGLAQAIETLQKASPPHIARPGDTGALKKALLREIKTNEIASMRLALAVLDVVARNWDQAGKPLQSVVVRKGKMGEPIWRAVAPPVRPHPSLPLIVLDATADDAEVKHLLGDGTRIVRMDAERHTTMAHIVGRSFSKGALGLGEYAPKDESEVKKANALRKKLLRMIEGLVRLHGSHRIGVVTYKELAAKWGDEAKRLAFRLGHFNGLRGLDSWKDLRAVVVIGRIEPSRRDVEEGALATWNDDPLPLAGLTPSMEDLKLDVEDRGLAMEDGRRLGLHVNAHPDPRVNARLYQIRDAELLQVIGRLRDVRPEDGLPKIVYQCNSVPLPLPVDQVMALDTFRVLPDAEQAIEHDGVLSLTRAALKEKVPEAMAGRGGKELSERQEQERTRTLVADFVANADDFRTEGELARFSKEDTSLWKTASGWGVCGTVAKGDLNPTFSLYSSLLPPDQASLSAIMGVPVGAVVSVKPSREAKRWVADAEAMIGMLAAARDELEPRMEGESESECAKRHQAARMTFETLRDRWLASVPDDVRAQVDAAEAPHREAGLRAMRAIAGTVAWEWTERALDRLDNLVAAGPGGTIKATEAAVGGDVTADDEAAYLALAMNLDAMAVAGVRPGGMFKRPFMRWLIQERRLILSGEAERLYREAA